MVAARRSRTHINATRACVLSTAAPAVMADNMQAIQPRVLYRLFDIPATSVEAIQIWNRRMETVLAYFTAGVHKSLAPGRPRD